MLSRETTTENPRGLLIWGSPQRVANNFGEPSTSCGNYYPFGLLMPQRSTTSGNTIEKFTGKERDEAIGLDYFSARYYDPAIPHFISVDPLADEYPSWSPYNYTLNNPVNLVDPTGLCPEDGSAGKNQYGPGECMEEVVVTAKRLPEKKEEPGLFSNTRRALPSLLAFTQLDSPISPVFDFLAGAAATGFVAYDLYRSFNPAPADQMMTSESVATWEDLWEGAAPGERTKGLTKQKVKDGGWEQANQDFDDLAPDGVVPIPGVGRTGVLPDGSRVTVKNKEHSSDDRPNLVRKKGKNREKVSYNE